MNPEITKQDIDDIIFKQRELCRESDIEVLKCKQALSIAESVREGRLGAFEELLKLKQAQRPAMTAQEHNAYPNGRFS